jgi:hypothetical protein
MILPELILPSRVNQRWKFTGIDHIDRCLDKRHFLSYPHSITYSYNSRGFRDQEWPDTMQELRNAVWCIGDSFTVGIGSPLEHSWPSQLSNITNRCIINVSMDGASNEWIARTTENIVQVIDPAQIVIMWSYVHRRENIDDQLDDEHRRIYSSNCTDHNDWKNFLDCKKRVDLIANSVHFTVPFFCPEHTRLTKSWNSIRGIDWPIQAPVTSKDLESLPDWILKEMANIHGVLDKFRSTLRFQQELKDKHNIIAFEPFDTARDGHHFDLITSDWVANCAKNYLI